MKKTTRVTLFFALLLTTAASLGTSAAWAKLEQTTNLVSSDQLKAFAQSKITARQAIAAAQAHADGGSVVEVKFDASGASPVYKTRIYRDRAIWEGEIDAQSGHLVGAGKTIPEAALDEEDRSELAGVVRVPTASLTRAVEVAENRTAGRVISAELDEINGKTVYELIVVKDGSPRRLVYGNHYD